MPVFKSLQDERLHRQTRLVAGFRLLAKFGYDEGVAGHLTCRDPQYSDLFWVNPYGLHFGQIKVSDLILVDHEGKIAYGGRAVNKAAFMIHYNVHKAREDAVCAVHSHSVYGKAFSTLGRKLLPITQDACAFYDDHSVFESTSGVVLDPNEGVELASALASGKGVILRNHGLLTVGKTVDEAVYWFIAMERACQVQLIAEAAAKNGVDDLIVLSDDMAKQTRDIIGNHKIGWFQFQPLYNMITKEQPDIFPTSSV
ncbi:class II aldolase/adducin N-terminal [Umbelopsis sp. PMI_123]|nr:class II aldolase/adducin N-terminal [Umbelopsis sp. PMI_123]